MYEGMTRDFHHDTIRYSLFRLEVRAYADRFTAFELVLVGDKESLTLDYMPLHENPEMADLYDFDAKQWCAAELTEFWNGLTVCLDTWTGLTGCLK